MNTPDEAVTLSLHHAVERIDALGAHGAIVVGGAESDLHFTTARLEDEAEIAGTHSEANANQGEPRSHGFFFNPSKDGGVASLPLRRTGGAWQHLLCGSASMLFLDVNSALELRNLGTLDVRNERQDDCRVVCGLVRQCPANLPLRPRVRAAGL